MHRVDRCGGVFIVAGAGRLRVFFRQRITEAAESIWYGRHPVAFLLAPLSWLFRLAVVLRRFAYSSGLLNSCRLPVPVVVVGNISVGGTGKTPLVIWIARFLKQQGFNPAIVTRGYGGNAGSWPQQVRADGDPETVGDEAVLLASHSDCPVAAGPDRVAAARALVVHTECDLILADDGLQHYRMGRDVEIAVVDGERRLGNRFCLPAGPLREPPSRLNSVDLVVVNGATGRGEFRMDYRPGKLRRVLREEDEREVEKLASKQVHAVAGIGNPRRFFYRLRRLGLRIVEHPFPDHHAYTPQDLEFGDNLPVLMTEKDAVKCRRFATEEQWYLPIEVEMHPAFGTRLLSLLQRSSNG